MDISNNKEVDEVEVSLGESVEIGGGGVSDTDEDKVRFTFVGFTFWKTHAVISCEFADGKKVSKRIKLLTDHNDFDVPGYRIHYLPLYGNGFKKPTGLHFSFKNNTE